MLKSFIIPILFFLAGNVAVSQESSATVSDLPKHKISRVDTSVVHCVYGNYGEPGYKRWDSTVVYAYIVLAGYPLKFDTVTLVKQIKQLSSRHGWTEVFAFRDEYSLDIFAFSSLYASQQIRKRNGFIGRFNEKGMQY